MFKKNRWNLNYLRGAEILVPSRLSIFLSNRWKIQITPFRPKSWRVETQSCEGTNNGGSELYTMSVHGNGSKKPSSQSQADAFSKHSFSPSFKSWCFRNFIISDRRNLGHATSSKPLHSLHRKSQSFSQNSTSHSPRYGEVRESRKSKFQVNGENRLAAEP